MKKISWIIVIVSVALSLAACAGTEKKNTELTTIAGVWNRDLMEEESQISLFRVVSGRLEWMGNSALQAGNKFAFAFMSEQEGFYVIGVGTAEMGNNGKYTFYFKPGDQLNVEVNDSSYTLTGKNNKENRAMAAWHDYVQSIEKMALYNWGATYVDFFPLLTEKTATEYQTPSTGNTTFDRAFADYRKLDIAALAVSFLMLPRSAHPTRDDFVDFYKLLRYEDFAANETVLTYPYGVRFLSGLNSFSHYWGAGEQATSYSLEKHLKKTPSDVVKGEVLLQYIDQIDAYTTFEDLETKYAQYIITDDQKQRMQKNQTRIAAMYTETITGKPAINFTHKDVNGKDVSLSDFKGKVVYVDVWATWCGPCRQELPALKEVEKKYHENKDIVFMSVSIDEAKDQQKWKDFLEKEHLSGVQLFGGNGWKSDIAKLYQIQGIPAFLLFDKKGNVVSLDAPPPSSGEALTELLDYLINR